MADVLPAPRPSQAAILAFDGGRMGIAAVPGSGKTWTLARLAAGMIREADLKRGQQILIVTLVNAARAKFEQQVHSFLGGDDLGTRYLVRTLHGLSNDIISQRPGLVGLSDDFQIIDEHDGEGLIRDAVSAWLRVNRGVLEQYWSDEARASDRQPPGWQDDVTRMAQSFIKRAKDYRLTVDQLNRALERAPAGADFDLARMAVDIYDTYERGLRYRGAVDFQDLIRLALQALESDFGYRERLQHRWPVILEDEAQDSSQLQESILRTLAGTDGSWVRVGDPNQAIFETFTTASPQHLRNFLREDGVVARELPESGRSAPIIIDLANWLIDWSSQHPNEAIREQRPLDRPYMRPLAQGNPSNDDAVIRMPRGPFTPDEERRAIAADLARWLPEHPDATVAILTPTNEIGAKLSRVLTEQQIEHVEQLRTTTGTRRVVGSLIRLVNELVRPLDSVALAEMFQVWQRERREEPLIREIVDWIRLQPAEALLNPRGSDSLLDAFAIDDVERYELLASFRQLVNRWHQAALLPVDQLILTLAGDLFSEAVELATAYSLALYLRSCSDLYPELRLPDLITELRAIGENRRKFEGLADEDDVFDPARFAGIPVVMTVHSAKGLEWDRVYLMSVSNYDYPSADPYDHFIGERWYLRGQMNLQEEALAQLDALMPDGKPYAPGDATRAAREAYAAERLRLLYVGMTRARQDLIITWNTGSRGDNVEARPLPAMREWLERRGT